MNKHFILLDLTSHRIENAINQVSYHQMFQHVFTLASNQLPKSVNQVVNLDSSEVLLMISFVITDVLKSPLLIFVEKFLKLIDSLGFNER